MLQEAPNIPAVTAEVTQPLVSTKTSRIRAPVRRGALALKNAFPITNTKANEPRARKSSPTCAYHGLLSTLHDDTYKSRSARREV